jgi:hypothetical protein
MGKVAETDAPARLKKTVLMCERLIRVPQIFGLVFSHPLGSATTREDKSSQDALKGSYFRSQLAPSSGNAKTRGNVKRVTPPKKHDDIPASLSPKQ